jgi:outer membrane lipoprotein-sorting protein
MFRTKREYALCSLLILISIVLAVFLGSCQPASNTNANVNANANMSMANSNANLSSTSDSGMSINAREPEKYSATLVFTIQTEGNEKAIGIPPLSVQVARSGADRRVEFKLPDGTPLIYLDHENRQYVIVPSRKQYAELSKEATGVQLQKLMTPAQIVDDLKNKSGVEKVGEEQVDGRTAEKYRYATAKETNTKAGQVTAEAFFFIDKETRLPLRTEVNAESSGEVKGVNAARIVAEMRDIKTDIDQTAFDIPAGYAQVAPEKVRQQIDALTSAVASIVRAMMANMRPEASASPSPTGSPK